MNIFIFIVGAIVGLMVIYGLFLTMIMQFQPLDEESEAAGSQGG